MRRWGKIVLLTGLLVLLLGCSAVGAATPVTGNPIDQAFANDWQIASSTYELNYVSSQYLAAWKDEMEHAAAILKGRYVFDEDKNQVDSYLAAQRHAADVAARLEWINWSDSKAAPDKRPVGTGAGSASIRAKAAVYKQATLQLIDFIKGPAGQADAYQFLYSGQGAELEKVKAAQQAKQGK